MRTHDEEVRMFHPDAATALDAWEAENDTTREDLANDIIVLAEKLHNTECDDDEASYLREIADLAKNRLEDMRESP